MEQQLAESPWNSLTEGTAVSPHQATVKERDVINRLEGQVDEQRKMRLNDAKQVEAKAAKIKEWVTNKLRDVRENKCQICRARTMSTRRRIKFNLQFGNGGDWTAARAKIKDARRVPANFLCLAARHR